MQFLASGLFGLLALLTTGNLIRAAPAPNGGSTGAHPRSLSHRATGAVEARDELKSTVAVQFPKNTRYVNAANETDTFWGENGHEFTWGLDDFDADPAPKRQDFIWIIYDQNKDPLKLDDNDRYWEMQCYAQASGGLNGAYANFQLSVGGTHLTAKSAGLGLSAEAAAVYCPTGHCVRKNEDCSGIEKPNWADPMA